MQLGGIPKKLVKGKTGGLVVDDAACLAAFPGPYSVPNALGASQTQDLKAKQLLVYQEVASEGSCVNNMPTVQGLPAAAYGRYCQSDLGPNWITGGEGFDNVLRVCPVDVVSGTRYQHVGAQDVDTVALANKVTIQGYGPLNVNCESGGNTDSGKYSIKIPDQAPLLSVDIDRDLNQAPKLEGVSPISADIIFDTDLVRKLVLTYPTCNSPEGGLSGAVKTSQGPLTNLQDITLHLTGQTNGAGVGSLGPVLFDGEFTVKATGVK
jgi:hypothetical protein